MRSYLHKRAKNIWALAIIGTPILGLVCSIVLTQISAVTGIRSEGLDVFRDTLSNLSGLELLLLVMLVGVVVPVVEELIFRGLLWKVVTFCRGTSFIAYLITSCLFALAHLEPLHVLGVLPLSFFIGWLKLKTDSILPGIAAHISNNLLACCIILL